MARDQNERGLAKRAQSVSGDVEDYREGEEDIDAPQAADLERFGDVTVKCPECGTEMYDDVAVCWKCGRAIMQRDTGDGVPMWVVFTVLAVLAGFAMMLMLNVF